MSVQLPCSLFLKEKVCIPEQDESNDSIYNKANIANLWGQIFRLNNHDWE